MEGTWLDGAAGAWLDWMGRMAWQVAILAGVVFVIALVSRKASPRFRYFVWGLVLIKLCLPPTLSFVTGVGYWLPVEPALAVHGDAEAPFPGVAQEGTRSVSLSDATSVPKTDAQPSIAERERVPEPPVAALHTDAGPSSEAVTPLGADTGIGEAAAEDDTGAAAPPAVARAAPAPRRTPAWPRALFLVWLAGVAGMAGLIVVQSVRLRRRLAGSTAVSDACVRAAFEDARRSLRIGTRVRLLASPGLASPILVGLIRPRVVLPEGLLDGLDVRRLRPIFLHELAHLKRRDPWVNWVQVVLQTVYWFHPLVWLANLRLRRERELIVDDLVLAHLKGGHEMYGESLLNVLRKAGKKRALVPGYVGIVETKGALARRLRRIADTDRKLRLRLGWASLAALVALALVLIPLAAPQAFGGPGRPGAMSMGPPVPPATAAQPHLPARFAAGGSPRPRAEMVVEVLPEDITAAEAKLRAAKARLDLTADTLRKTEQRVKIGRASKNDLSGLRVEHLDAEARVAEAKAELARLRRAAKEAEKPWPVRFQAVVYRVKIPPERLSQLDVQSLARQSAGATAFKAALAKFGPVNVLYRVDQAVDLASPSTISVTERRPFVTAVRATETGRRLSTVQYQDVGARFRFSKKAQDAGRDRLAIGLEIELSDIDEASGVDITRPGPAPTTRRATGGRIPVSRPAREGRLPVTRTRVTRGSRPPSFPAGGLKAQVFRQVTLVHNGLVQLGQPFAMLSAGPPTKEKDGAAVAYVARLVLSEQRRRP